MREQGFVKMFSAERGFGFIRRCGLPDVFFHVSQIVSGAKEDIGIGLRVEFEVEQTDRGFSAVDLALVGLPQ